jgi:hypothetical protein
VTQDRATPQNKEEAKASQQQALAASYYGLLGLHPSASVREIRQAYRDLSKLYHPDTTALSAAIATTKFQQLNEAYATLSSPERRTAYDRKIGYSSVPVVQPSLRVEQASSAHQAFQSSSAYLDPTDRPLSPGEIFALFILGITFVGCLVLAIAIGITRGEAVLQPLTAHMNAPQQVNELRQDVTAPPHILEPALEPPALEPPLKVEPTLTIKPPATQPADVPIASPPSLESGA